MKTKPWYRIEFTTYTKWPSISGIIGEHTTWSLSECFFESVRKANKFLSEHPGATMSIVYR